MDAIDRIIERGNEAPLTSRQCQVLASMAHTAFLVQKRLGLTDMTFDQWRHAVVSETALGCRGLRDCTQKDFVRLRAAFREYRTGSAATNVEAQVKEDERRRAMKGIYDTITQAVAKCVFSMRAEAERYAESLARKIHGCSLEEADARTLQMVNVTMRNRVRAIAKKMEPKKWTYARCGRNVNAATLLGGKPVCARCTAAKRSYRLRAAAKEACFYGGQGVDAIATNW